MVTYPGLTEEQQSLLPKLKRAAISLPVLFEDSTHQLWQCETHSGPMIFKVCQHKQIEESVFWQGMNHLFNADFPTSLQHIEAIYQQIATTGELTIPNYIASKSSHFVLASWLEGTMLEASQVNDAMVNQLANHLGKLHNQTQTTWGPFHQATLPAKAWPNRLCETIQLLAKNKVPSLVSQQLLNEGIEQAKKVKPPYFSPIMPDLRWDQFLQQNNQLSALVDLDAVVFGPPEIELILLEYLLTEQQADNFKKVYQQHKMMPDLSQVRTCYRLLLFLMNVLGERSQATWFEVSPKF